ncbi:MAG: NosD domain-containing protein [Thermoplasmata archaeon]
MKLESKSRESLWRGTSRTHTRGFPNRNGRELKEDRWHAKSLAVFVLILLVLSIGAFPTWQTTRAYEIKPDKNTLSSQRINSVAIAQKGTPHAPIHINGDSEFTLATGVVAGSGTPEDPYIIEGWEIDANGGSYSIWIENTTVNFVIKNCVLRNATNTASPPHGTGIAFTNVKNGRIEGNEVTGNSMGIRLALSTNNSIRGVNASGNSLYGITLYSSPENTVGENSVTGNEYGIYLSFSNNTTIINNTISGNSRYGIYLSSSLNTTISGNILSDDGIMITGELCQYWNTHHIEPTNLINGRPIYFYKDREGGFVPVDAGQVILANCTNMKISGLNVTNTSAGVLLGFSTSISITENNISGNFIGIYLYASSNTEIISNNVSGNLLDGVYLFFSNNNTVRYNKASDNLYGIHVWRSRNNTLLENNASDNFYAGICIETSANNHVEGNTASANQYYGISLASSWNNTIISNNVSVNNYFGIILDSSDNNLISENNASRNSCHGIYLYSSYSNRITYNWLYANTYYGVYVTGYSTNNSIHHNNFIGNGASALRYLSQGGFEDTLNSATKGVSGGSQAYDGVGGNFWCDNALKEGNYWSNWDGNGWGTANAYPIAGGKASDWYPLGNPVGECISLPFFVLAFACVLILARVRETFKLSFKSLIFGHHNPRRYK